MPIRRLRKHPEALEVSAFINLIVVLVPFLLSTAVFSRISIVDMTLPARSSGLEHVEPGHLLLEVVVRHDKIEVNDKNGGQLYQPIPVGADGPDLGLLSADLLDLKKRFPDTTAASLLPEPNIPYDEMIQVMDTMRTTKSANGGTEVVDVDLFPAISIGDAPVRR
ncbi:MAG TPA: biopolymer transporter ExbD [Burkholderiaceae bacterium]